MQVKDHPRAMSFDGGQETKHNYQKKIRRTHMIHRQHAVQVKDHRRAMSYDGSRQTIHNNNTIRRTHTPSARSSHLQVEGHQRAMSYDGGQDTENVKKKKTERRGTIQNRLFVQPRQQHMYRRQNILSH